MRSPVRGAVRDRIVAALGLTVIWVLLWGRPTWTTVAGGLLVATVILTVFPLPQVAIAGRVHPAGLIRLVTRFIADLVVASVQVALLAFRFGHVPRSAILAVRLRAPSDLNLTLTAEALSLVPGSLIVEVDRDGGVLYVHVLGMRHRDEAERFRQSVLELEARIVHALGTPAERRQISRKEHST
jgi:multicomponent Na+:H+ antiporter subunit E